MLRKHCCFSIIIEYIFFKLALFFIGNQGKTKMNKIYNNSHFYFPL